MCVLLITVAMKYPSALHKWLVYKSLLTRLTLCVVASVYTFMTINRFRASGWFCWLPPRSENTVVSYLQCTAMGPASGGLHAFTRLRNARNGVGCSGTPWSGHAVNWNCLTSLFSLEPFWMWRRRKAGECFVPLDARRRARGQDKRPGNQPAYFKKCKCPDAVRSQLHCVQQCHLDEAIGLCASWGPILVTFHLQRRENTL